MQGATFFTYIVTPVLTYIFTSMFTLTYIFTIYVYIIGNVHFQEFGALLMGKAGLPASSLHTWDVNLITRLEICRALETLQIG